MTWKKERRILFSNHQESRDSVCILICYQRILPTAQNAIVTFAQGVSIASAATVWNKLSTRKKYIYCGHFCSAAVIPRKIKLVNDLIEPLMSLGCAVKNNHYNRTLARITGCMLLESNEFCESEYFIGKLGGKSPLTATRLSGKALQIQQENSEKFPQTEIDKIFEYDRLGGKSREGRIM